MTEHLLPAAGEEIFHRVDEKPKILQKCVLERRSGDLQMSQMEQHAMRAKAVKRRGPRSSFASAPRAPCAGVKVFRRRNARWEMLGTLLRDNEDEKR